MAGLTGTLRVEVAVTLASEKAAAVRVTVKAAGTVVGAVYVTPVVVELVRVPQLVTVQPVRVQVTPALSGPPVTVALKLAELPGSMVALEGPVMVTPVGVVVPPPQPLRAVMPSARKRAVAREIALRKTRWRRRG
jgi:hypothetical protein